MGPAPMTTKKSNNSRKPTRPKTASKPKKTMSNSPFSVGPLEHVSPSVTPAGIYESMRRSQKSEIISDMEPIHENLTHTTFFKHVFNVNPGNSGLFPRLSKRAMTYESYRFKKLILHYLPATATSVVGALGAQFYTNMIRLLPSSLNEFLQSDRSATGSIWSPIRLDLKADNKFRFILDDLTVPADRDDRLDNCGKLLLAAGGSTIVGHSSGFWWLEYVVELKDPAALDFASPLDEFGIDNASITLPTVVTSRDDYLFGSIISDTTSYGNLELNTGNLATGDQLIALQPAEGTMYITVNGTGFDLSLDSIEIMNPDTGSATTAAITTAAWVTTAVSNFVNWNGTVIMAAVSAKILPLLEAATHHGIKFLLRRATTSLAQVINKQWSLRFLPNDVLSLTWPVGNSDLYGSPIPMVRNFEGNYIPRLRAPLKYPSVKRDQAIIKLKLLPPRPSLPLTETANSSDTDPSQTVVVKSSTSPSKFIFI